jgi:SAM-dependent methyltransferase
MTMAGSPEDRVKACYSTWGQSYFDDYYGARASYPPVHLELIRGLLRRAGAHTVLDAGCGPASVLRALAADGLDVRGFDLTPEMVNEARRVLGVGNDRIWEGSVLAAESYRPPAPGAAYDAALCVGVLPHLPEETVPAVFAHLRAAVRPGGLVILEARNQLFGLFTQNRPSYELIVNDLIRAEALKARAGGRAGEIEALLEEYRQHFRMDLPPVRGGKAGEPGYDEVLSRTDNPLTLAERLRKAGFTSVRVLFYHYHCLPPSLAARVPDLAREQSLAMEDPEDWRGHFMASAFLLAGERT